MLNYQTVISTETAIKMTYFCSSWPTMCWLVLKLHSLYLALGLDCHRFLWLSLSTLAFSIWYAIHVANRRRKNMHKVVKPLEREINRQAYEASMDNLLAARALEQSLDQYESLFKNLFNKRSPQIMRERRARSLSVMPRKTFQEPLKESSSLKLYSSISTQTTPLNNTRLAAAAATYSKFVTKLQKNQSKSRRGINVALQDVPDEGNCHLNCDCQCRMMTNTIQMAGRNKKLPLWRN